MVVERIQLMSILIFYLNEGSENKRGNQKHFSIKNYTRVRNNSYFCKWISQRKEKKIRSLKPKQFKSNILKNLNPKNSISLFIRSFWSSWIEIDYRNWRKKSHISTVEIFLSNITRNMTSKRDGRTSRNKNKIKLMSFTSHPSRFNWDMW